MPLRAALGCSIRRKKGGRLRALHTGRRGLQNLTFQEGHEGESIRVAPMAMRNKENEDSVNLAGLVCGFKMKTDRI